MPVLSTDFRICDKIGLCCSIQSCLKSTHVVRYCSHCVKKRQRIQLLLVINHSVHPLSSSSNSSNSRTAPVVYWNFHGSSLVLFPVLTHRNALFTFVPSILLPRKVSKPNKYVYISYKYIYTVNYTKKITI